MLNSHLFLAFSLSGDTSHMLSYDLTVPGLKAPALCPNPLMEEAVIITILFPVDGH